MNNVIMLVLGTVHEVSDNAGIFGNLHANRVVDCPHRGQSMDVRSDPAGALHEMLGIARITPLENHFDAPEHLPGAPGIHHFPASHLDFNPQVALDSGYRVDRNSLCHMISSLSGKRNRFR
jgi:hypothetical protein